MASSNRANRAVSAGLSAGLGLILPFTAYIATAPFGGMNEVVRADAAPFAIGALAGIGLMAASGAFIDSRSMSGAHSPASGAVVSEGAEWGGSSADSPDASARAESGASNASDRGARRRHRNAGAPEGVPVIQRAADALDEESAWAEIDSMLSEDSPISCDPSRSMDLYQIALAELRRGAGAPASTGVVAQPGMSSQTGQVVRSNASSETGRVPVCDPSSTSVFIAAASASTAVPAPASPAAALEPAEVAARAAAMESLGGTARFEPSVASAVAVPASATPMRPASASSPATSAGQVPVAAAVDARSEGPAAALQSDPEPVTVPMADYSGHESMWAAALDVMAELDGPSASHAAGSVSPHPVAADARYADGAPVSSGAASDQTSYVSRDRMAAVAEGGNETKMHAHVNELLEDEIDRVPSSSVRKTGHDYLRVIQGGTASFPRLQAEA